MNCGACGLERGSEHVAGWTYATDNVRDAKADYALCPSHSRDCAHPDDDRAPLSGDDWICTLCQTYVDQPGQVTA